ncbi:MAG: hypothetical protein HRT88_24210, partial [Lentisphaeraceae bacterium]|nr:hypothetical protein [Lentisphaeraceae bacterium]
MNNISYMLIILSLFCFSCTSSQKTSPSTAYSAVNLRDLVDFPGNFTGKKIILKAYVLGSEFNPNEDDAQFFILSLGEKPQQYYSTASNIIFPEELY